MPAPVRPAQRNLGLDVLRILLALVVFAFHSDMHYGCRYGVLTGFVRMGSLSMTGFFMLSGFALYLGYSQRDVMSLPGLRRFYVRRFLTLIPVYYVIQLIYCLTSHAESTLGKALMLPLQLLLVQSSVPDTFARFTNGGMWFLSCLIFCYAVYPFAQHVVGQMGRRSKLILLAAITFLLVWMPLTVYHFHFRHIYANPFPRMLEFLMGVVLASRMAHSPEHSGRGQALRQWWLPVLISLVLIVGVTWVNSRLRSEDTDLLLNALVVPAMSLLIPSMYAQRLQAGPRLTRVVTYLSSVSFPFFLAQSMVFDVWGLSQHVLHYVGVDTNLLRILVSFLICTLLSILLHELIQRPSQRLAKRIK